MMFLLISCLLLIQPVLSYSGGWRVYVDMEIHRVIEKNTQHAGSANMLHAVTQISTADFDCPSIMVSESVVSITSPCGSLQSFVGATFDAQPVVLWIMSCPKLLWIELRILVLELPLSGPTCIHAYIQFQNLLGDPPTLRYCGRRPEEVLYSSGPLKIMQHISRLLSPLHLHLIYEFISPKTFTIGKRSPVVLQPEVDKEKTWLLGGLQPQIYGTTQIYSLHIPFLAAEESMDVTIVAGECSYVVHDGPGQKSLVVADSHTRGAEFTVKSYSSLYIQFSGTVTDCEDTKITITEIVSYFESQRYDTIESANAQPIDCVNATYFLQSYEFYHSVIHTKSSPKGNTWCKIRLASHTYPWTFSAEMTFIGPNQYVMHDKASVCQFGGL